MDKQLHVLHILPYLESGGTEKHVLTLISTLRELGLASGEVLAPPGPFACQLHEAGIQLTEFVSPSANVLHAFRTFRSAFRHLAPAADIVHIHGAPDLLLFTAMARGPKRPRVLTVHGFHGAGAAASYRFAARLGNRFAQAVICVAGSEERLLLSAGIRTEKLHRVYNGVADPQQSLDNTKRQSELAPVRIAFIGRLSHVKGVDVLLRALARMQQSENPQLHLEIMGEGDEEPRLTQLAKELGLEAIVEFLGYRTDAVSRLASCDIFCLPSREDMGPLVCVEAMAQGIPLVATTVGGIPEIVVDGETGLLVPSDDVNALAVALARLAGDAALRERMGTAGRTRYETHFTQESMGRSTFSVYKKLLS